MSLDRAIEFEEPLELNELTEYLNYIESKTHSCINYDYTIHGRVGSCFPIDEEEKIPYREEHFSNVEGSIVKAEEAAEVDYEIRKNSLRDTAFTGMIITIPSYFDEISTQLEFIDEIRKATDEYFSRRKR